MRSAFAATVPVAASTTDIASASGSIARTYRPTEVLCMPRKANGSLCVPAAIASTSVLRRRGIMDQAVAAFQSNLASVRTGRASVHILDSVKVDYYGTPTPISQLAQVSAPEAQLILISPWDPTVGTAATSSRTRSRSRRMRSWRTNDSERQRTVTVTIL